MKAKAFDKKFDQGKKDIIDDLDLSTARRANRTEKAIYVYFSPNPVSGSRYAHQ